MATFDVAALVARVLADSPMPATVGELDDGARDALEAAARRQSVTPEALLAVLRAQRAKAAEADDEARRIALEARAR